MRLLSEAFQAIAQWMLERRQWLTRYGALVAGIVLGGVVFWSSGLGTYLWHDGHQRPKPVVQTRPAVVPAPPTVKNLQREVTQGRLGTDSSVSKVPLRLLLIQTLPGRNVHSGQALLGVDRDHPQTYLAGAILENGARLDEIYPDHVVLVRGTHRTSVYLERPGTAAQSANADALVMVGGPPPPPVESPRLSHEPVTDFLRPVPVYENGVITGFQVYPGKQAALFNQWGLKAGDVVTALDGQPVSDADQLMDMLRGLTQGQALTATVQRNGAAVSLALDGADLERLANASAAPVLPPPGPVEP